MRRSGKMGWLSFDSSGNACCERLGPCGTGQRGCHVAHGRGSYKTQLRRRVYVIRKSLRVLPGLMLHRKFAVGDSCATLRNVKKQKLEQLQKIASPVEKAIR